MDLSIICATEQSYFNPLENSILQTSYCSFTDLLGESQYHGQMAIELSSVLSEVGSKLDNFLQKPDFINQMQLAFGKGWDLQQATNLIKGIVNGKSIPQIDILPIESLQAKGAYAGDSIYLAQELFSNPEKPEALVSVLLEELGHYVDSHLNVQDSPGDEGAIFAQLVLNQPLQGEELLALKAEDDSAILNLNGKSILVEQAALDSGTFTVGVDGKVSIEFLADAGSYHSELGIFSLQGMGNLQPGSLEFIQESARRVISNSNSGYLAISDATEGAKFSGDLGESERNDGRFLGEKNFVMNPGDQFAFLLVPDGKIRELLDNPNLAKDKNPLFSIASANADGSVHFAQLGQGTTKGGTFGVEDKLASQGSDWDYNDFVFQIKGATGKTAPLETFIQSKQEWRNTQSGKELIEYAKQVSLFLTLAAPFSSSYTVASLGELPGLPTPYVGLAFKADDPNTLYIGSTPQGEKGEIFAIALKRDANNHIVGFTGSAKLLSSAPGLSGGLNDAGLTFGPNNVLFYTTWNDNTVGQIKLGSSSPDKQVELNSLGYQPSVGGLTFVPQGFPGAGRLKITSYDTGNFYDTTVSADGTGTWNIAPATKSVQITGGPDAFIYVSASMPQFTSARILLAEQDTDTVSAYNIDANGDPIPTTRQEFLTGIDGPIGAAIDPLTGDFFFSTYSFGDFNPQGFNQVVVVRKG
ncbi:hypothetical protein NIES37_12140 [Tolypothrix tenuis PCC 7101]|uniref:DUF4114 domain-containing protein n=1 Tax=Tolypothrix tenuis PCC 7101 TaxID=231146 RepID=A0A1Z4MUX6_9CYAN|nr:DUF4114 domain-containing protein [Aulosira sp. FACHB-113]BAY97276.1 hypothetical protein NIES37_12140 [Tolypothrix tenuis PCC 7101]BAZ72215.1 hypothetical protein NIES50_07680 [Aulosira laxa NIES-50]